MRSLEVKISEPVPEAEDLKDTVLSGFAGSAREQRKKNELHLTQNLSLVLFCFDYRVKSEHRCQNIQRIRLQHVKP